MRELLNVGQALSYLSGKQISLIKFHPTFPIHRPYRDLIKQEKEILWNGTKDAKGINTFFSKLEKKKYKFKTEFYFQDIQAKHNVMFVMVLD